MRLLASITDAFIAAFGITQPTGSQRRTVTLVLGGFLLASALAVVAIGAFLLWQIHTSAR